MAEQHGSDLDCRICGEHFHSQQELERHNRDEHAQRSEGIGSSGTSTSSGGYMNAQGNGSPRGHGVDEA